MSAARAFHLRSSSGLYGAEQMLLGLCAEQQRRGQRPTLCSFVSPAAPRSALLDAAAARGLPTQALSCDGMLDLGCLRALRRQLLAADAEGDTVLHCHDYKSVCYGRIAARGLRLRRVATAHGWIDGGARLRAYRALELRMLRGFDRVCAVSGSLAEQLRASGLQPQRVAQIDNGIDVERFRMREHPRAPGWLRLGTAARLSPEKNLGQLIEALAQCRALGVDISLTILGDGPQRGELEQLIGRLQLGDRVSLPGMRAALEDWYPQLDAFVLVSLSEGMPLAVLEALACGCPVLASDVGALPRVLEGLPGCHLVPVADPSALVGALRRLQPRLQPDPRLRQRVIERYALTRMAEAYAGVYEQARHP